MDPKTLVSYFEAFSGHGEKTAFFYKTGYRTLRTSYRELCGLTRRIAARFDQNGLKKGDRVILWGANSPDWAAVFFASLLKGMIAVPLDIRGTPDFTAKIFKFTKASLLIHDRMHPPPEGVKTALDFETVIKTSRGLAPYQPESPPDPQDPAEILFTSGTTADPKGVLLTHENIAANITALRSYITEFRSDEKLLSLLPLSHIFEQTIGLWLPLSHGCSVTYLKGLTASSIFKAFEEDKITAAAVVPRILDLLRNGIWREIERQKKERLFSRMLDFSGHLPPRMRRSLFPKLSRLFGKFRYFIAGGAVLEPGIERFWEHLGIPIIQGYGLTETSPVITLNRPKARRTGSIGKVLPGVELRFSGEKEIQVRAKSVFTGYYRSPEKTREVFDGKWFKTGDLGEIDTEGFVYYRGRKKDLIVTSEGLNVYPDDLEAALRAVRGIKDCCVVGLNRGDRLLIHAALIPDGSRGDAKAAVDLANQQLAGYQKIQSYSIWPEEDFPRTATLKVKKSEVIAALKKEKEPKAEQEAGGKSTSRIFQLLARLAEMPVSSVRPESRLGDDLGLSSLDRVELAAMMEEEFHQVIPDTLLGSSATVGEVEAFLRSKPLLREPSIPEWPTRAWARALRGPLQDFFFFPAVRLFCRCRVEGAENLEGLAEPAVFIANHSSYFDGPVIFMALPRRIRERMAPATWRGFFEEPEFKPLWLRLWKQLSFYPASLGFNVYLFDSDRGIKRSLEHTGRLLDRGFNILLFPEAARTVTGEMNPFKPGIGMLASSLHVPVVPAAIKGLFELFPPGKAFPRRGTVTVRFGKPVYYRDEDRNLFVERLQNDIKELLR